jgi:calcineurin-like phosphoesterase family protein
MDAAMIGHWNNVVGRRDLVYHLGDFAYNRNFDSRDFDRVFNQLNGKIIFIKGNHDKLAWGNRQKFHESYDSYHEAVVDGQTVILCHYAMRTWKGSHRGTFHLYGHSHGTLPDDPDSRSFDCGVDCHSFSPISFDRVKEIMATKNFKPVDHHGK